MNEQKEILMINIDLLVPNKYQPRKIFNESSLNELAASIKEYGILNPILVRKATEKYEIIAGERRYRAAKMAGLSEVPVIVKSVDENKLAEIALIENLQRENISPIEEAESYEQILSLSSLTEEKLSKIIGKSQSFISNKLRLLKLPDNIKDALKQKKISERHARSLLTVEDEIKQEELLNRVINEKLTVKELDNIINEKQITEEEINKAINDIMKTLEISDEEKEEKESDNMNNGNFFPNMNQNQPQGDPASLNMMNMQTMNNQQPIASAQEMTQPIPSFGPVSQPEMAAQETVQSVPSFGPAPQPEMVAPNPMPEQLMYGVETPNEFAMPASDPLTIPQPEMATQEMAQPIPSFGPVSQPEIVAPSPMPEQPLFNSEASFQASPVPTYEVPVTEIPDYMNTAPDKLTMVQDFLNTNGINYKSYSNETGHCIIIEL